MKFSQLLVFLLLAGSAFAWRDSSFPYRTPITISNSGSELTDYQAAVDITNLVYNNTGLVGSWHFSEGLGTRAADSSGNGNDGTLNGPIFTTGKFGTGLQFDGSNDYVDAGNATSLNPTNAITLEAWIRYSGITAGGEDRIVSKIDTPSGGYSYSLALRNTQKIQMRVTPDGTTLATATSATSLLPNTWYHMVGVYDGSNLKLYINSQMDGTPLAYSSGIYSSNSRVIIGARYRDYADNFNGTIDEVRIYNRSLSVQEISDLYNAGKARLDYADLRFTWPNQSSGAEQEIPYWLENDKTAWVKVPSIPAGNATIYAYYGDPSATYDNSLGGNNTFDSFDDFSTNTISDYTERYYATWFPATYKTITNGELHFGYSGASYGGSLLFKNKTIFTNAGYIMRSRFRATGYYEPNGISRHQKEIGLTTNTVPTYDSSNTCSADFSGFSGGSIIAMPDTACQTTDVSGITTREAAYSLSASSFYPGFWVQDIDSAGAASELWVDWFFVRKYALPEPTVSSGAEQQTDKTAPSVQIQSPTSQAYTSASVPVNFTATDNAAVSCTVRLNGTVNSTTCSNYSLALSNGAYTLNVTANDTAGNTNSSQVSFTVAASTGPQSSSSPQISTVSGIADGNVTFSFTPAALRIKVGAQEYSAKTMRVSAGVNKVQINARIITGGQNAPDGTKVTYTLSE